jgi:hypothetical protein
MDSFFEVCETNDIVREVATVGGARAWIESYDDFQLFLEDAGITIKKLPGFAPATAVMVVALWPGTVWIKQVGRAERRRYERLLAKGRAALGVASLAELDTPPWVRLKVVKVDAAKVRGWRRDNNG